jgi:uncharacterized LabA/DUF88 family protein
VSRDRLIVFVDGSNLLVELSKELKIPFRADRVPEPAIAISRRLIDRTISLANPPYDVVRRYWFGSFTGSEDEMIDARLRLRKQGFEPVLFKSTKGRGEKGVDIALATSMLGDAFRQNYDFALLVAGDEDYVTLVNEAKHHGRVVNGAFFERDLATDLRLSLDNFFALDVSSITKFVEKLRPQFET